MNPPNMASEPAPFYARSGRIERPLNECMLIPTFQKHNQISTKSQRHVHDKHDNAHAFASFCVFFEDFCGPKFPNAWRWLQCL